MSKINLKKVIKYIAVGFTACFAITSIIAKLKKNTATYKNEPSQKNPLEGKQVVFVYNENEPENADGVRGHLEAIGDSDYKPGLYEKYVKRGIDILLSFGGLVVLSPFLLGISVAIIIDDPGPVLFTQKRLGKNKEFFKLHKFRSMKMCTPHDVPTHMLDNPEQYITKVGKFLRAHSLDELPQIWDIFMGNMSVIGPRPGLWNQDLLTSERDKYQANDVRPGLTGWAQINGRDELEIPDKAKLDGYYVAHMGLWMDIKVFLGSLHVFGKDDSVVEGGTGEMKKSSAKEKVGRHYTDGKSVQELIGHIGFGEPVVVDTDGKKKVLITGAGSYIGESFIAYAKEKYPALEVEELDMLDGSWREKNFADYDTVYHVAGIAHADVGNVDDETKEKYYAINTDLAVEVCKKAKMDGVKEFIFMSSMIVYGDSAPYGKRKVIDANTVPTPANFYGDSKLQADVAVRALADDQFKVIVLRPPMIYGKGSKGNYPILAKFAKKLPVFPNVDNERSMLYIENLCEFLCQVMLVKEIKENAIVLIPQNGEWTRTSEMVKMIAEVSGKKIKLLKLLKPAVWIGGKVPGKIGGLVNKAFGNSIYIREISSFIGINYQITTLKDSIDSSEGNAVQKKTLNNVCIINCFDTYEHRVDLLHEYFSSIGVDVKVITSDYKHFDKCKRTDLKEDYELIDTIPYKKNMSVKRLKSHAVFSYRVFKKIKNEKYDLLWVLIPPNSLAKNAAKYKVMHRETKLIFDLIDLWPETMPISMIKTMPPFTLWKNLRDMYLNYADEIVTECDLYHEKMPKKIDRKKIHTIYLAKAIKEYAPNLDMPKEKIALCYLGSINNIIDISATADIVKKLTEIKPVVLHVIGDGEKRGELIIQCEKAGAEVVYHGKVYNTAEKQKIFDSCHYGLNIMKKSVFVGLTMKSMDYFEAGLPIINNIYGDTWHIIEQNFVGYNIDPNTDYRAVSSYKVEMRDAVRKYFEENLSVFAFNKKVQDIVRREENE